MKPLVLLLPLVLLSACAPSAHELHSIAVAKAEVARRGHSIPATWDVGVMPIGTAPEPGPTKDIVWFTRDHTFGSRVFGVIVDTVTGAVEEFIDMRHPSPPPEVPPSLLRRLKRSNRAMQRTAGRPAF